jgi:hypothetical protein
LVHLARDSRGLDEQIAKVHLNRRGTTPFRIDSVSVKPRQAFRAAAARRQRHDLRSLAVFLALLSGLLTALAVAALLLHVGIAAAVVLPRTRSAWLTILVIWIIRLEFQGALLLRIFLLRQVLLTGLAVLPGLTLLSGLSLLVGLSLLARLSLLPRLSRSARLVLLARLVLWLRHDLSPPLVANSLFASPTIKAWRISSGTTLTE